MTVYSATVHSFLLFAYFYFFNLPSYRVSPSFDDSFYCLRDLFRILLVSFRGHGFIVHSKIISDMFTCIFQAANQDLATVSFRDHGFSSRLQTIGQMELFYILRLHSVGPYPAIVVLYAHLARRSYFGDTRVRFSVGGRRCSGCYRASSV